MQPTQHGMAAGRITGVRQAGRPDTDAAARLVLKSRTAGMSPVSRIDKGTCYVGVGTLDLTPVFVSIGRIALVYTG